MDVEQFSWAAIPDNQEQIIRYTALHRINLVYQQESALNVINLSLGTLITK